MTSPRMSVDLAVWIASVSSTNAQQAKDTRVIEIAVRRENPKPAVLIMLTIGVLVMFQHAGEAPLP